LYYLLILSLYNVQYILWLQDLETNPNRTASQTDNTAEQSDVDIEHTETDSEETEQTEENESDTDQTEIERTEVMRFFIK